MDSDSIYIGTRKARDLAKEAGLGEVSLVTIHAWINKYKFGKKIGGRYRINEKQYLKFLKRGNQWKDHEGPNNGQGQGSKENGAQKNSRGLRSW